MIAEIAYLICALTSILCAVLLVRSYRQTRTRLLLWSSLCFVGLAINNVILFADMFVVPGVDLEYYRNATALASMLLLLCGLIWEER